MIFFYNHKFHKSFKNQLVIIILQKPHMTKNINYAQSILSFKTFCHSHVGGNPENRYVY